jgi:hypothetical protein
VATTAMGRLRHPTVLAKWSVEYYDFVTRSVLCAALGTLTFSAALSVRATPTCATRQPIRSVDYGARRLPL